MQRRDFLKAEAAEQAQRDRWRILRPAEELFRVNEDPICWSTTLGFSRKHRR